MQAHPERRLSLLNLGVVSELRTGRYDLMVVFGWAFPVNWVAFLVADLIGLPFLLFGDTDVRDPGSVRFPLVRRLALASLCRRAAGALYAGTFNRDFYIRHGMNPERLWFAPLSVDNDLFAHGDGRRGRVERRLREDLTYFLFVGTLIERKRPDAVLSAIAELQRGGDPVGLILAGSGPLEPDLRCMAKSLGLRDVHFLGFVNQRDLPQVYAAADVLVLPSQRDPRGTVVNEAMAAGLPVVVSSGTGVWGPGDLVRNGREGFVVPVDDHGALVRACCRLKGQAVRARMGGAARRRVEGWSYRVAAEGWVRAVEAVCASRRSRKVRSHDVEASVE